jgi:hypothetical protein
MYAQQHKAAGRCCPIIKRRHAFIASAPAAEHCQDVVADVGRICGGARACADHAAVGGEQQRHKQRGGPHAEATAPHLGGLDEAVEFGMRWPCAVLYCASCGATAKKQRRLFQPAWPCAQGAGDGREHAQDELLQDIKQTQTLLRAQVAANKNARERYAARLAVLPGI